MELNDIIHGFRVIRIRHVADAASDAVEMEHERTGARLLWMKNDGENKLFSVAFKTIPVDDTGVFHILEHSVLGGSEKYPVKEPFLELLKGSLNTFLNAMTFPDKTVFPVSSRNDRDFMNLTQVYLDAVFCPAIYKNPCIFEQEGWHVEWDGEGEPLYKGVVFNEMKGANSSVYSRITKEMSRSLFPDNCYRFESGGDPEAIVDLTYEKFLATHKSFYHPSNSYFYLDGPVDVDSVLKLIDEYISPYDRDDTDRTIPRQKTVPPSVRRLEYAISPEDGTKGQTHFAIGKVMGDFSDREKMFALTVLSEALAGSNDSPLKRALLDSGLCLDVGMGVVDGIEQPFGILEILNTDEENCRILVDVVEKTVREQIEKGVDREALSAAINRMEFRFREGSEPKGLDRDLNVLSSWLYGGDPLTYVDCGAVFDELRKSLATDSYEKLLEEWFLEEDGRAQIIMAPSVTFEAESAKREQDRVIAEFNALDEAGKADLLARNQRLAEWQRSVDSPEALSTLPTLPLEEVDETPMKYDTDVTECDGITVLRHCAQDPEIVSLSLYFIAADLTPDELSALKLASSLLGELPTSEHTGIELQQKITSVFGDVYFTLDAFSKDGEIEQCTPYFVARGSFLRKNEAEAFDLLLEIMSKTLFIPEQMKEQFLQNQEDFKHAMKSRGNAFALRRVRAPLSSEAGFAELTAGYEAYRRLGDAIDSVGDAALGDKYRRLIARIACRSRLTVGVTSASEVDVSALIRRIPAGECSKAESVDLRMEIPEREAINVPIPVSHTAMAFSAPVTDLAPWRLLSTVLSLEYLWNEVRVKGGAYGAGCAMTVLGQCAFYSFRDPAAAATLETYRRAEDFLRAFFTPERSLDKYIIGTVAKQEPLISDGARGNGADELYFRDISDEKRIDDRRRLLRMTPEKVISALDVLSSKRRFCVVGSETAIGTLGDGVDVIGL